VLIALSNHGHPAGCMMKDSIEHEPSLALIELVELAAKGRRANGGHARGRCEIDQRRQGFHIDFVILRERSGQDRHYAAELSSAHRRSLSTASRFTSMPSP